ncbi:MAG: PaaI family thioesterase [Candidatus Xenobia bacterium]
MEDIVPNRLEDNHCFCCGPHHPHGLRLRFYRVGDEVRSDHTPDPAFCGFTQILHGGIQAAILDEICIWTVVALRGRMGATAQLDLTFLKPVRIGTPVVAAGWIVGEQEGRYEVAGELRGADGTPRSKAVATITAMSAAHVRRFTGWKVIPPAWKSLFPD